ncbi:MAG TPA: periplasmic heavy metal sensor [Nitrospirae bacterium]|nr:periplasmic heavy metal sensor [Nitrospirota bacterium]
MRNNNILKFALIASLLLNISMLATAGYMHYKKSAYGNSPFGMKIKKGSFLFDELSLKPEQARAMREKAIPFRSEIDRKRMGIAQKRKELINLMRADDHDIKAIDSVISEISRMQEEMQRKVTVHMLEEKALLDKEQQKKLFDLIENAITEGRRIGCPPTEHN